MTLKQTDPTPAQTLFLNAAISGLMGSMTEGLRRQPADQSTSILDAVQQGIASFVWTVEAQQDVASFKLELVHVSGPRLLLSTHTVSLVLEPAPPTDQKGLQ